MNNIPLEGLKIVTAHEMARIEGMAYAEGASEQTFMENAGEAVAEAAEDYIHRHHLLKTVTLLVGKGNNGGDAYAAGTRLLDRGFNVSALHIYALDKCGPLCKIMYEKFRSRGGSIHHVHEEQSFRFEPEGIILDGLVGTGFHGKAEDILALAIESANGSELPILAIDIPSGLNGNTGEVESVAIRATETIFLGLPKIGFFLKEGWDHVGTLKYASFGLHEKYIDQAKTIAYLFNEERAPYLLPPIQRTRHKYQAGFVLAIAGSPGMPGAALLASYAVLRAGAGIVRLFHPSGMEAELSGAPYELIRQGWDEKDLTPIKEQTKRAKALLVGPGIGRTKKAEKMLKKLLISFKLPMVIDADALFILSRNRSWKMAQSSVLTPHRGEMELLLSSAKKKDSRSHLEICQAFAEEKKTTVVLKGAPTFLFHPGTRPLIIGRGDPGMATAGSGDVLTGIIAAMLAQGLDARRAAALAVYIHQLSGEAAAANLTSYCVTASDLIDFLPDAFSQLRRT
jgi:ADP-dependent NAD(P)H-hydrate dehydratase / NAD(P)H-hydrate epimerase